MITQAETKIKKSPRITLDEDGNPVYRTQLLTKDAAERFSRCLLANPRYLKAEVEESGKAIGLKRFFVCSIPARKERRDAMTNALQDSRIRRAEIEGPDYRWHQDDYSSRHGFVYCESISGEVYEVTHRNCSCPDWEFRCRKARIQCKHQIAYAQWMADEGAALAARQAEIEAAAEAAGYLPSVRRAA